MKRSTWISVIDVFAFVSFLFLIATGVLIRYVLPPGSGGVASHVDAGRRVLQKPVSLVWGLTRHEWGDIHFWLSVIFLIVVALHLLIHWKWIRVSFKGRDARGSRLQIAIGLSALAGLLALAVAPLLSPKKTVPRQELQAERGLIETDQAPDQEAVTGTETPRGKQRGKRHLQTH